MNREAGVKTALALYGVKLADANTLLVNAGLAALGAGTLLATGVAINDAWKGRKFDAHDERMKKFFADTARFVDTKAHVLAQDPRVTALTNKAEIKAMLEHEFKEHNALIRKYMLHELAAMTKDKGGNAAMLPGLTKQYVIARPRELPEVLNHELGHASDYREKGLTHKDQGPYEPTFLGTLWKPRYEKEVMRAEREAWNRAPDSSHKKKIETAALGTYDTTFHNDRAGLAGAAAMLMATTVGHLLMSKLSKVGFEKLAKIDTELQPHQKRVVQRLLKDDQPGLVAMHGLGSGKTLTSIAAADALGMPADVVLPAALRANYQKELQKHAPTGPPETHIQSLENVARNQTKLHNPFLVVDEAHRSRNPSKTQQALKNNEAKKRLLLTGSLFYNAPSDAASPVNLVAGGSVLPSDPDEFRKKFVREREYTPGLIGKLLGRKPSVTYDVNPKTKAYLQSVLNRYVDYHPSSKTDFPERTDETIGVPMADRQKEIYDTLIGRAPKWVHERVVSGLPPKRSEVAQLNRFLQGTRQVSNSTAPYHLDRPSDQPKIDRAAKELNKLFKENPAAKAIVYSSYLDAGINPYKKKLDKLQIPYGEFTGALSRTQRDQMVKDYNANKLRALLLSRAGGEGLDLQGTRLIQLLEPHWNEEALKQVIGRGIRYRSHAHLPEEQRNVHVQHFVTENPRQTLAQRLHLKKPEMSVDQYLMQLSKQKEDLNQKFRDLLSKDHG